MKKNVSIKHIAEALGVSTASVSLVLGGNSAEGRVGKEIADKIRQTAKTMNYRPNGLARSLRVGKTNTIGLIVADISNPFFANMAFHVQEKAENLGYTVIIANTNEDDKRMERMIDILKSRQVDGYLIVPTENGKKYISQLKDSKIPLVLLDRYFPDLQTSNVIVDNYRASYDSTRLLLKKGCRNICLFVYKSNLQHIVERKKGYCDALKEAGLYREDLLFEVNYASLQQDMEKSMNEIFRKEGLADGLFFTTNSISTIGIKELLNRNIRIEEDIQVVCFDKSDAFDFMDVPIPYVRQPIAGMGQTSVDILVEQILKKRPEIAQVMCKMSAELVETTD